MTDRRPAGKDVMVVSAASGAGHMAAADALVTAFRDHRLEATHIEMLGYSTALYKRVYADLYVALVNRRPRVLGQVYGATNRPWRLDRRRLALDRLNTRPLARLLEQRNPAAAICTHFLPPGIVLDLRGRGRIDTRVGVVITDYDAHAMWLYRDVDWYFVACNEVKAQLTALGIGAETIHVTGIPIGAQFAAPVSTREARARMHLDLDRTTVLVVAGGFGMGPVEALVREVDKVAQPIQVVVICGKNAALERRLRAVTARRHAIRIVGYTREMDTWMACANLLVGKAGGMTSSEAFARGTVLVVVNPIPGWEERNSDYFVAAGAAIRCDSLPALAGDIDTLLSDRGGLARMRDAAARLAHPHAASEIAGIVRRSYPPAHWC